MNPLLAISISPRRDIVQLMHGKLSPHGQHRLAVTDIAPEAIADKPKRVGPRLGANSHGKHP
jgi:hypothetical protein